MDANLFISTMAKHGVHPVTEEHRGKRTWRLWDPDQVAVAMARYRKIVPGKGNPNGRRGKNGMPSDLTEEQTLWTYERRIKQKVDNDHKLGQMVLAADAIEVIKGIAAIYAQGCDALAPELCDAFPGHSSENRATILKLVRKLRNRTADALRHYAAELESRMAMAESSGADHSVPS